MLAIQQTKHAKDKCTPNILPCRIHHDGPAKVTKRYWAPTIEKDGSQTAYFRGRKLRGRVVRLPARYQGLVLKTTERVVPNSKTSVSIPHYDNDPDDTDSDAQEEPAEPTKIAEQVSSFDEFVVWGHDQVPALDDTFVRNVNEWIGFAEAIHGSSQSTICSSTTDNHANGSEK